MNLKDVKGVEDKGSHFLVEHAKIGKFQVVKHGLDKQSLGAIQKLCSGGPVLKAFTGTEVPNIVAPAIETMGRADSQPSLPPDPAYASAAAEFQAEHPGIENLNAPIAATIKPFVNPDPTPVVPQSETPLASNTESAAPAPVVAPVKAPTVGMPSTKGIERAIGEQKDANVASSVAEQNRLAADQVVQQHTAEMLKVRQEAFDTAMKTQDDDRAKLQKGIADTTIDPQRLWNNTTTGGKIASTIGILLSGIGAGMSKSPNLALETMNKMIDQDIDAQKANLGKQESLLADNYKKTGDMRLAEEMTKSTLLQTAQAQLNVNASKYGGPKVAANAALINGQLDTQWQQTKYSIAERAALLKQQQTQTQLGTERMMRFANGTANSQDMLMLGAENPKAAELATQIEPGKYGMTYSSKNKENFEKINEATSNVLPNLTKLEALNNGGLSSIGDSVERSTYERTRAAVLTEMNKLHDLNRLTDLEYNAFKEQLPDVSTMHGPWNKTAVGKGISEVREALLRKLETSKRTDLMRPAKAQ